MMSKKNIFPEGTTWQQAYGAFDELAGKEVPGAFDAVLMMEAISHGGDPDMVIQADMLHTFRRKYEALLLAEQTI
jgi:2-polyprenyl-3-methyl-5-hydroxy-6-metoxy-1,4-benzoquinol methylase